MAAPDTSAFYDIWGDSYSGLTDTSVGFSGSSTLQSVQLGSPIPLDTATTASPDATVVDLLPQVPSVTSSYTLSEMSQMLSGASDVPPNPVAAAAQTNTPNAVDSSASSWSALTALSKFGASVSSLFGGQPRTVAPAGSRQATYAGAPLPAAYNSGSFSLVTVIVIAALVILLLRND